MIQNKPLIGLTSNIEMVHDNVSLTLYLSYPEAIKRAGGIPIVLPLGDENLANIWVSMCDGILLTGGNDVHPQYYDEDPESELGLTTPKLDKSDMSIINVARSQRKPIFGICRGSHLINVALGGTMIQHIEKKIPNSLDHLHKGKRTETKHKVTIDKDSRLYRVLQKDTFEVNSFHHQALDELGEGLRCVATAPDGVKEAFESEDEQIMGTQFHPEELGKLDDRMHELLVSFVEECRKAAEKREAADKKQP